MSQPPDYLPEDPGWRGKPKDEYDDGGRRGCTWVVILALIFGIFALGVGGEALYIYDPTIIQSILDLPNLPQTQQALDLTAQHYQQQATQAALDTQQTQAALGTREGELNQTATQGILDLWTTQTAIARDYAQRATQAAFDLSALQTANANDQQATQNAFSQMVNTTQTQAAFELQSIQNQLGQEATQQALDAAASQTQAAFDVTATQEAWNQADNATATALSNPPVATPPANAQP